MQNKKHHSHTRYKKLSPNSNVQPNKNIQLNKHTFITYKYNNKVESIYAKLEYYNYSGSIKDRIIKHILDSNDFKKGDTKRRYEKKIIKSV